MKIFMVILLVVLLSGCGLMAANQGPRLTPLQRAYVTNGQKFLAENLGKTWDDWAVEAEKRAAINGPKIIALMEYEQSLSNARNLERIADAAEWQSIQNLFPQPVIIVPTR